jgi:hypothetical protein
MPLALLYCHAGLFGSLLAVPVLHLACCCCGCSRARSAAARVWQSLVRVMYWSCLMGLHAAGLLFRAHCCCCMHGWFCVWCCGDECNWVAAWLLAAQPYCLNNCLYSPSAVSIHAYTCWHCRHQTFAESILLTVCFASAAWQPASVELLLLPGSSVGTVKYCCQNLHCSTGTGKEQQCAQCRKIHLKTSLIVQISASGSSLLRPML